MSTFDKACLIVAMYGFVPLIGAIIFGIATVGDKRKQRIAERVCVASTFVCALPLLAMGTVGVWNA